MAFITAAQMKTAVAARLALADSAALPAHAAAIAADVVESAYWSIVSALGGRGFTAAQIAAWDRGAEYNRRVGLCHYFREAALQGENYPAALDQVCKCEEDLAAVTVTAGGVVINPSGDGTRISTGEYSTADDAHTIDDEL